MCRWSGSSRWRQPGLLPPREPRRPRLYTELAAALQPAYASDAVPLAGPRAAADLAEVLPAGGLVAAEPGAAGFWVARSLPDLRAWKRCRARPSPARSRRGGGRCSAAQDGRPTVLITDALDDTTASLLDRGPLREAWRWRSRCGAKKERWRRPATTRRTPLRHLRRAASLSAMSLSPRLTSPRSKPSPVPSSPGSDPSTADLRQLSTVVVDECRRL